MVQVGFTRVPSPGLVTKRNKDSPPRLSLFFTSCRHSLRLCHPGSGAGERRPSLAEGAFEQVEVGAAYHRVPVEIGSTVVAELPRGLAEGVLEGREVLSAYHIVVGAV